MPFLHPWIFWTGLIAVSAPILIHILNRRRFRTRAWAAMQFLLESVRKNRRRLQLEELVLLAIRCLVILLLGIGLARFAGCGVTDLLPGGSSTSQTVVFILDDSYSMGQRLGPQTLFNYAIDDLSNQLRELAKTDRVAIILASQPQRLEAGFELNFADQEALVARVQSFTSSDSRARLAESLAAAAKTLSEGSGEKKLYLLGDFRRADMTGEGTEAVRREFTVLQDMGVEPVILDYGRSAVNNLTIEDIRLLDKFAVAKVPFRVGVTVHNYSPKRAENIQVRFFAKVPAETGESDDSFVSVDLPVQTITGIDPGRSHSVECSVTLPQAGPAAITAELVDDELLADNAASLALDVRPFIRVLVVDGRLNVTDKADSASYFFVNAIDDGRGSYGTRAEVIPPTGLHSVDFNQYDVVALLNVPAFPELGNGGAGDEHNNYPKLRALERYVRNGGGLIIFTGDRVNLRFYREEFYNNGAGLMPLPIRSEVGDSTRRDTFYRFDPQSIIADGFLRCFGGNARAAAMLIRIFAFNPSETPTGPAPERMKPPRILARFTDPANSPAIVSRSFGRGTVVAFFTSAGLRWNDWPIGELGTYPIMLNDLITQIARSDQGRFTGRVGDSVVFDVPLTMTDYTATLKTPAYPAQDVVSLRPDEGGRRLRYALADRSGLYAIALERAGEANKDVLFARNVDGREGDLTPANQAGIADAVGNDNFRYEQRGPAAKAVSQKREDKEYWMYAIIAALGLLALETYLARRFGHYA